MVRSRRAAVYGGCPVPGTCGDLLSDVFSTLPHLTLTLTAVPWSRYYLRRGHELRIDFGNFGNDRGKGIKGVSERTAYGLF